ncbi:MAG: NADH-quinone oxidoreductase subunit A [Candidatus Methanomethylicaceae archaeon]
MENLILPITVILAILLTLIIFIIGGKISQKALKDPEKLAPYACGEDVSFEEARINLEKFLIFALYFLIFDVITFIMAISFFERGILPGIYSIVALASILILVIGGLHK